MLDWDEAKRISNLKDHEFDFENACLVFECPKKFTTSSDRSGETRWMDIAEVAGKVLALVYTIRGETVRIISYRAASRKERTFYYENIL